MIVYCTCNICKKQFRLNTSAKTRQQLANESGVWFTVTCPLCNRQNHLHVNNVRAESSYKKAPKTGAIVGGIIGILGGPLGVMIGAGVGALGGGGARLTDKNDVDQFNKYYI